MGKCLHLRFHNSSAQDWFFSRRKRFWSPMLFAIIMALEPISSELILQLYRFIDEMLTLFNHDNP
jgi:hypothetical protein